MTRSYVPPLLLLAAIWGSSYLFIKVAVRDFEPTTMITLRLLVAAAVLLAYLARRLGARRAAAEVRAAGRDGIVLGIVNAAAPFTLIAWGEKHVPSGIGAIGNAAVPIFVALIALRFRRVERVSGLRLVGLLVGLVGVGVLTGLQPEGGLWPLLGTLAILLSSVFYATGSLYGAHRVSSVSGPVLAAASMLAGGLLLLPFGLLQLPAHLPGWKPVAALAALTLLGTALAQLILFRMLRLHGSSRTTLVTYLMAPAALVYGAVFLREPLTLGELGGLALILCGVALGSGLARLPRRRVALPAP